jgi:dipeptidyl peptidase-like protein
VIASHYAEPVERVIAERTPLHASASNDAEELLELAPGEPFWLLDDNLGWAWGYAGAERRVGYVKSEAVLKP